MADDDEYVEGDAGSEAADAPGAVPTDEAPARAEVIDSVSVQDAPIQRMGRNTARTVAARKAFAEAVLASKKAPQAVNEDLEDPEDAALAAAEPPKPEGAKAELAAAKAAAADPTPVEVAKPAEVAPPAPSLDPEVRKLREQLAAERDALAAQRAELEKKHAEPVAIAPDALSLEDYIDSPPKAYRTWLEAMRGEKFATDDEFKAEVKDFITSMSTDVLGVALPENVRAQFDAAQARKIVRTTKTIQARKEAAAQAKAEQERKAAAERAETDRIEHEWKAAAASVGQMFMPQQNAEGKPEPSPTAKSYPWLAAEEEPGKIVVDVIRAAVTKDGTQLSWQEASKRANDYLAEQAQRYIAKRKPLLGAAPTPAAAPAAPSKPKPAAAPVEAAPPPAPPAKPQKWNRDKHIESTKAAFRQMISKQNT